MTLPFGKYLDVELDQVPDKYLVWLITGATAGLDPELVKEIRAALLRSSVRKLTQTLAEARAMDAKILKRLRVFLALAQWLGMTKEAAGLRRELQRVTQLTRKRAEDERARAQEQVSGGSPVLRAEDGLAGISLSSAHQNPVKGLKRVS